MYGADMLGVYWESRFGFRNANGRGDAYTVRLVVCGIENIIMSSVHCTLYGIRMLGRTVALTALPWIARSVPSPFPGLRCRWAVVGNRVRRHRR